MMEVDYRAISLVERRDGFVYAQPQPYGKSGTGESFESIPPFGLLGRPRGPDGNGAPNVVVLRHGPEGFTIAVTDPRYQASLPDLGDGGAGLYANVEVGGAVNSSFAGFYGKGGEKDEGTFRTEVNTAAGITTIEVNATTGDVTIAHAAAGGAVVVVKAASVELGAESGGMPLVKDTPFQVWAASVVAALSAVGQTISPPAGTATTKVNGT